MEPVDHLARAALVEQLRVGEARAGLASASQRLNLAQGLVANALDKAEGGVRYWTQRDVIGLDRGHMST